MKKGLVSRFLGAVIPVAFGLCGAGWIWGWFAQTKTISASLEKTFNDTHIVTVNEVQVYKKSPLAEPELILIGTFQNKGMETSFLFTAKIRVFQNGVELSEQSVSGFSSDIFSKTIQNGASFDFKKGYKLNDTTSPVEVRIYDWILSDYVSETYNIK